MSFKMFPKNAAQCCSPLDAVLVSHHLEVGLLDGLLVHGGGHVVLKREHISIGYTNYLFYLQCVSPIGAFFATRNGSFM